jgi:regulator of sigma E protease
VSWLLAFAGFAALIVLHEAGHFAAAKAVGMKVEKFYLFFPPKLVAFKRGETEYGIGAIPLGGFVKITGMNPDEDIPAEDAHRAYYASPVWKRIVVIAAGPIVNVVIAFAILFVLAFYVEEPTSLAVGGIEEDSPAQEQLQNGDELISIAGVTAGEGDLSSQAENFSTALEGFRCEGELTDGCSATEPADVVVTRDGERTELAITPFYDADPEVERFRLGFQFEGAGFVPVDTSPGEAVSASVDLMWRVTTGTVEVIGRIFEAEQREQISSVVGSYEVTRQAINEDAQRALTLLAIISLSLAIINLFPFLPLDGGHIFFAIVEKVRGRPISFSVMERASVVGFVLVLALFAVGLSNDIGRITGEGFEVP